MNTPPLPKYDVHVCLVSEQTAPNLLPVLDAQARPELVLLLATPIMNERAGILAKVVRSKGVRAEVVPLPAAGLAVGLRDILFDILARYEDRVVACNVTGGTKLMALAALEVCRGLDRPAFYVNTDEKTFITLSPTIAEQPLPDLFSVKDILMVQGYDVDQARRPTIPEASRALTEQLVRQASRFKGALGVLNKLAMDAFRQPGLAVPCPALPRNVAELFELFTTAGRLKIEDEMLSFPDEESRSYANGGWLEEYAASVLYRLQARKEVKDFLSNIHIRSQGGVENELDLAFTAQNRLFVIECKTANIAAENGKAEAATYKMEALRDLVGGRLAKAMLLSFVRPAGRTHLEVEVLYGPDRGNR